MNADELPSEHKRSHIDVGEAIVLCFIWLCALISIVTIVVVYHGDQSVSLENAVGYIMLAVVCVTVAILFRDAIVNFVKNNL